MTVIKLYTDGACSGNPGPGGWGVVYIDSSGEKDKVLTYNGSESSTTNNRMELRAAIEGIKKTNVSDSIILVTDSKYVKNGITEWIESWKSNNWKTASKEPVKNQDLWKTLDALNSRYKISWRWIKAHQENKEEDVKFNNMADTLARGQ